MSDFVARYYPESRFGGFTDVSGTVLFYARVRSLIRAQDTALDVGCGRGGFALEANEMIRALRLLRGQVKQVIGIDVDPVAAANPYIDQFHLLESSRWPLPDCAINIVISDWVMEHVEDPAAFLAEAWRALAPGGYLCLRTTNRLGYVGLCSALIPSRYHARILGRVQKQRDSQDVFPTLYRCNTVGRLRRALSRQGSEHCVYGHEAEPSYLRFSGLAFSLGVLYQKLAPRAFGNQIFVFARKPAPAAPRPEAREQP